MWAPSLHHDHSEWNTAAGSSKHSPGDGTETFTTLGLSLRESRPGKQAMRHTKGITRHVPHTPAQTTSVTAGRSPSHPLCRQPEPGQREPSKELRPGRTPHPQGPQASLSGSCTAARGRSTRTSAPASEYRACSSLGPQAAGICVLSGALGTFVGPLPPKLRHLCPKLGLLSSARSLLITSLPCLR
nr:uncharacterized protein LOC104008300 isoform X1 [Pan troglodytes]XP_054515856.1 uncharacterized protein LOC104008300 isoform X1 [Pan troglodytes]